jgi:hypothetical protein
MKHRMSGSSKGLFTLVAWKESSPKLNFRFTEFSEVQQSFRTRTWGKGLRGSGPFASFLVLRFGVYF